MTWRASPQSAGKMYAGLSQQIDFDALPEPGERFSLETLIGEGTYGEVHAARDREQHGTSAPRRCRCVCVCVAPAYWIKTWQQ